MLSRMEQNLLEKLIKKAPNQAAVCLSKEMGLSESARQELLCSLLEYPLAEAEISRVIASFFAYDGVSETEQDKLLEFLLSRRLSQVRAVRFLEIAERLIGERHESVTDNYRETLLAFLLREELPTRSAAMLSDALLRCDGMRKEQREAMLDYLLEKPLSKLQLERCFAAVEKVIAERSDVSPELKERLLLALLGNGMAKECAPKLTHALITSDALYKNQREEMLEYILEKGLSKKQLEQCVTAVTERAEQLKKEQWKPLLEALQQKEQVDRQREQRAASKAAPLPALDALSQQVRETVNDAAPVREKMVYFEGAAHAEGIVTNEIELLLCIAEHVGPQNIIIKRHPNSKVDRFTPLGFKVMEHQAVPGEGRTVLVSADSFTGYSAMRLHGSGTLFLMLEDLIRGQTASPNDDEFRLLCRKEEKNLNREQIVSWRPATIRELGVVLDAIGDKIGGWGE